MNLNFYATFANPPVPIHLLDAAIEQCEDQGWHFVSSSPMGVMKTSSIINQSGNQGAIPCFVLTVRRPRKKGETRPKAPTLYFEGKGNDISAK